MWDGSGHTVWEYDGRGRIITERRYIDGKVYITRYQYDAMDRVTSMTYPDGEVVNYTYNTQLLLATMAGWAQYITGTNYNAAGQPTSITYNGVVTTMGYNPQTFRLTSISAPGVGLSLGYEHFPNGNIQRITEGGVPTDFGYDELDRLTSASGAYSASYGIDQIGRLQSKVEGGTSHTYQYLDPSHKHAPNVIDGVDQGYDANGNLASTWPPTSTQKYDAENRLAKVSDATGYVARFANDGEGRRVKRLDTLGTVHYAGPHYERNVGTGADTTEVITKLYWVQLGPYRRLIAVRKGGTLYYLHHDHLGSTKAVSGTSGGPYKYYPFGYAYQEVQSPPTDNLYTGQKRDLSTGLYYYGARYYNPAFGLFIQPDTIVPRPGNPQSLNRYSYVLNNPLRYTDPNGRQEEEENYYVFVGGYGTTSASSPGDWANMIKNLGLADKPGSYGFFEWETGWSGGGTASKGRSTADAATELAGQIGDRKNVTLVGHSKGGALIMEYLAQIAEGKIAANPGVSRAFTIDSPLQGDAESSIARFQRMQVTIREQSPYTAYAEDRLAGLSERLLQRGMAVDIAMLDNPNEWVGHGPIPGIPYFEMPLGDWLSGHRLRTFQEVHGMLQKDPGVAARIRLWTLLASGGW